MASDRGGHPAGVPRLASLVVRLAVGRAAREFVTGDLIEGFADREAASGRRAARRWYRRQALAAVLSRPGWSAAPREVRPPKGDHVMTSVLRDIRFGARQIVKQPLFSLVVVTTLALAIGANTVIFSFANPLLLRPLPIRDPGTVGWIYAVDARRNVDRGRLSHADFVDVRDSISSFASLTASRQISMTLSGQGDARQITVMRVLGNFLDVWGLDPVVGRGFTLQDSEAGALPVLMLSHGYWQREFGGKPSVVGSTLTVDGVPHTVIGVMTPTMEIGNLSLLEAWTPLVIDSTAARDQRTLMVTGRLRPGVSHETAGAEVAGIAQRLANDHPATNTGWAARVATTRESITGPDTWTTLALLVAVVGLVLLIACANLANLMLARSTERQRELAVRAALGAGRLRLVSQLLTENLLLGAAGGIAALALAEGGLRIIRAAASEPFFELVVIDRNVLMFVAAVSLLTPFLFSVLPALYSSRTATAETLKAGTTRAAGSAGLRRSRAALVVSQVAMSMMLLAAAGLFVRSMVAMQQINLGLEQKGLLTFLIDAPEWKYRQTADVAALQARLLERLQAMPGVGAAAAANRLPILSTEPIAPVTIEGRAVPTTADQPWAVPATVSDDYFRAAGIPVRSGRAFTRQEAQDGEAVALISAEMARRHWPDETSAIGARLTLGDRTDTSRWMTIVGVVGDIQPPDFRRSANPHVYVPLGSDTPRSTAFLVRTNDTNAVAAEVRALVRTVDADLAVYDLRSMQEAFAEDLASSRVLIGLFSAFALVALALAAAGLYGVISYSVSQRTQEIGIRVAIGALPADVVRLVSRQVIRLVSAGAVIGLGGGLLLAQAMRSLLFGVSATDPTTFGSVAVVLTIVAALASWLPARRAMRIDPVRALRAD